MKDFAIEEKQMYLDTQKYWEKVEKRLGLKMDVKTAIAEIGFVAIMVLVGLFFLVQG